MRGFFSIPLKAPKGGHCCLLTLARLSRKGKGKRRRNPKTRSLSHICQVVLLNVGSLTKEDRNAFPKLSAGISTCAARKASIRQAKNRCGAFQNGLPPSPGPSKINPWGLQNEAQMPPRRNSYKTFNLRTPKNAGALRIFRF